MKGPCSNFAALTLMLSSTMAFAGGVAPIGLNIFRPADSLTSANCSASAQAAAQVMAAQSKLNIVRSRVAKALENDAELVTAQQNAIDARRVFNAVRRTTVAKLGGDPAYVGALLELGRREEHLSSVRESGAPFDTIVAEAKLVMAARSTVRAIEQTAYKDDLNYDASRQAMVDANTRIAQLKADMQNRIVSDPDFIAARDQLRSVRQQFVRSPQ